MTGQDGAPVVKSDGEKELRFAGSVEIDPSSSLLTERPPQESTDGPVQHPAKFNDPILKLLDERLPLFGLGFDPFAGVNRIQEIATEGRQIIGVEIEEEWASQHPNTVCKDFFLWAKELDPGSFDFCVTSPTFANRMADHHDAKEKCRNCNGNGIVLEHEKIPQDLSETVIVATAKQCPKCDGVGRRDYVRNTYRHKLGRPLSEGSSAGMQWNDEYRTFHKEAWTQVRRLLGDDKPFFLDIKDHYRTKKYKGKSRPIRQMVTEWHIITLLELGFVLEGWDKVATSGNQFGANGSLRVPYHSVLTFRS